VDDLYLSYAWTSWEPPLVLHNWANIAGGEPHRNGCCILRIHTHSWTSYRQKFCSLDKSYNMRLWHVNMEGVTLWIFHSHTIYFAGPHCILPFVILLYGWWFHRRIRYTDLSQTECLMTVGFNHLSLQKIHDVFWEWLTGIYPCRCLMSSFSKQGPQPVIGCFHNSCDRESSNTLINVVLWLYQVTCHVAPSSSIIMWLSPLFFGNFVDPC